MGGIVIIGAGESGVRAAFALRDGGYSGPIDLLDAESDYPYERPPLSKDRNPAFRKIRDEAAYVEAKINIRLGVIVEEVDTEAKSVSLNDGSTHSYDKLLFATGARPRLFHSMEGCLTLRTRQDAIEIMTNLVDGLCVGIVGGGFIGLELAATARKAGVDVTVLEAAPRLLGRAVPEEIASVVASRHEGAGVEIRTDVPVVRANKQTVTLRGGDTLNFDMVIAGVGAVPNSELAEAAGLPVDNGILVDGGFRTPVEDVFAAGDCCNFPWRGRRIRLESWKSAQDQAAHAAAAMLGSRNEYDNVPWFWSDQYDMTLQVAGLFDMSREVSRRETGGETQIVFQCGSNGQILAAAGIGPGNSVAREVRLLEKLIERGAAPGIEALSDPSTSLKGLLKLALTAETTE